MSDTEAHPPLPPLEACTVSHDIEAFAELIDEMDRALDDRWGDLAPHELDVFLAQKDAAQMRFIVLPVGKADEAAPDALYAVIDSAKAHDLRVILVAGDLSPSLLHGLLRRGGDEFIPYPPPAGALEAAIDRVLTPDSASEAPAPAPAAPPAAPTPAAEPAPSTPRSDGAGVVIAVQGLSGGTGATTFAVNLANELSLVGKSEGPTACLLDLDLQFGNCALALDLDQRPAVMELLSDLDAMDDGSFQQALQPVGARMHVLTSPEELVPLDFLRPDDIARLIATARAQFDYVVIDMPHTITDWTEIVLRQSQLYFALMEMDLRSAHNCVRFKAALEGEGLPTEPLRFILNRAPKFTDLQGRARARKLCETLKISIEVQLPDGGKNVSMAADQGETLAQMLPKSLLRKDIAKLAAQIHKIAATDAT